MLFWLTSDRVGPTIIRMEPGNVLSFSLADCINDVEVGPGYVPLNLQASFHDDVSDHQMA